MLRKQLLCQQVAPSMKDGSTGGMKDGSAGANSQEDERVGFTVDMLDSIGARESLASIWALNSYQSSSSRDTT